MSVTKKPNPEMVLEPVSARILTLKLSRAKGEDKPVVMALGLETDPLALAGLQFMLPSKPLAFWGRDGEVDEKAPSTMAMKYKTPGTHQIIVDDTIEFDALSLNTFKTSPAAQKKLLVTCTMRVIEPDQSLVMKLAQRIKTPIMFEVIGAAPDDQQELEL